MVLIRIFVRNGWSCCIIYKMQFKNNMLKKMDFPLRINTCHIFNWWKIYWVKFVRKYYSRKKIFVYYHRNTTFTQLPKSRQCFRALELKAFLLRFFRKNTNFIKYLQLWHCPFPILWKTFKQPENKTIEFLAVRPLFVKGETRDSYLNRNSRLVII